MARWLTRNHSTMPHRRERMPWFLIDRPRQPICLNNDEQRDQTLEYPTAAFGSRLSARKGQIYSTRRTPIAIKKLSEPYGQGLNEFRDVDRFQVKAFPGRQGFCVRERSTPPGYEVAAVVTRSHPAPFEQTGKADPTKTPRRPLGDYL
jgi:hypothetical protein